MKLIFVFAFVFSFGALTLLAENIPHQEDSKAPASNPDDLSVNYRFDPQNRLRRARGRRWIKVNKGLVCFGTRNNQFGRFYVPKGRLASIKLVHQYGYVTCNVNQPSPWSYWGCGGKEVNVVITTARNRILLPPSQFLSPDKFRARLNWSVIPGFNSLSPTLVLRVSTSPFPVSSRQELRLWYGEDLVNLAEGDNLGSSCVHVYARFA